MSKRKSASGKGGKQAGEDPGASNPRGPSSPVDDAPSPPPTRAYYIADPDEKPDTLNGWRVAEAVTMHSTPIGRVVIEWQGISLTFTTLDTKGRVVVVCDDEGLRCGWMTPKELVAAFRRFWKEESERHPKQKKKKHTAGEGDHDG